MNIKIISFIKKTFFKMGGCKKTSASKTNTKCLIKAHKACIKQLGVLNAKIDKLESANAKIDKLESANAKIDKLESANAKIDKLESANATIDKLDVTSINIKGSAEKNCPLFENDDHQLKLDDPLANSGNFIQVLWDKLVEKTNIKLEKLKENLKDGRKRVKNIQGQYGCNVCPPDELEVNNNVHGTVSFPPYNFVCGKKQILSTISYNFDVVNTTETLDARVVSILLHVGYFDFNIPGPDKIVYGEIDFGHRQFEVTLDEDYGEKYSGTIVLPTDLITRMSNMSRSDAIVQLVIFAEEGVEIDRNLRQRSRNGDVETPTGPVGGAWVGVGEDIITSAVTIDIEPKTGPIGTVVKMTVTVNMAWVNVLTDYEVFLKVGNDHYMVNPVREGNSNIFSFTVPRSISLPGGNPITGTVRLKLSKGPNTTYQTDDVAFTFLPTPP